MQYILIIQSLLALIKAIEQFMPDSTGKEKLEAVLTALNGLYGEVPNVVPIINTFVATLHASGIFAKKPAAPTGA